MVEPNFLALEDVLQAHAHQIARYGGTEGTRDLGLLESAIAQPRAGVGDQYHHPDIAAMAGAYLFHIIKNHPFVDGNKRSGLEAALLFLDLNGVRLPVGHDELYALVIGVADSSIEKDDAASFLRPRIEPRYATRA